MKTFLLLTTGVVLVVLAVQSLLPDATVSDLLLVITATAFVVSAAYEAGRADGQLGVYRELDELEADTGFTPLDPKQRQQA